ncbi:P-loop containing nucleoside triphosphate hydrolase protein [Mycena latifolia]|nr:P-loop containing nucleoside triphosphate hydrolase protein [Mycena latifolia]
MQGFLLWARRPPCIISYQRIGHRFRSQVSRPKPNARSPKGFNPPQSASGLQGLTGTDVSPHTVLKYFRFTVEGWTKQPVVQDRLVSFGVPKEDALRLLFAFGSDAQKGAFDSPDAMEKYDLKRLSDTDPIDADIAFSHIFARWLLARPAPVKGVDPATTDFLRRIIETASSLHPAEQHPATRQMRRRVIMHVGPTNSGKTHHALRALAAAPTGMYAGPLRLLAYEIWERLNMGHIVPLGATDAQIAAAAQVGPSTDNPLARMCDMITGEEQKLVVPENMSGLVSCTVEMVNLIMKYDVAVVDEIQMIGDRDRGPGWTRAVLSIRATELHLCGEETAVPLVTELLKDTGDELIVKRYERLTPLEVEEASLENDLKNVRKGDCIVTFSRSSIFALKQEVERSTGLKCAVVYGKLPSEIRSEQAALFNDPKSGYDVLIGSDAIGMGLNLKIRRVVFEAVRKFDGRMERLLSVSQMKQIAGRAGRFGLHAADQVPGGFVTTLRPEDLPVLRRTMKIAIPPIMYARSQPTPEMIKTLAAQLPAGTSTETMFLATIHLGLLPPHFRHCYPDRLELMGEYLDRLGDFTVDERMKFMEAPFPWRDATALDAICSFIKLYYERMHIDVMATVRELPFLAELEAAEAAQAQNDGTQARRMLFGLEVFHKLLTAYMWLSLRKPVAYPSYDDAIKLKERLERVLHWCLQVVTVQAGARPAHKSMTKAPIEFVTRRSRLVEEPTPFAPKTVPRR